MKHSSMLSSEVSRPLPPIDGLQRPRPPKRLAAKALFAGLALAAAAGCAGAGSGSVAPAVGGARGVQNVARALPAVSPTPVPASAVACDQAKGPKGPSCGVKMNPAVPPGKTPASGLTPAQLRGAYGLSAIAPSAVANGPLIAIVDAYDTPHADDDLKTYRAQFNLPPCRSDGSHCLTIVKSKPIPGASPPPPPPPGGDQVWKTTWADETTLDLAMASAGCPTCRILLVQAPAQDLDSLAAAVNVAASYHPAAISNSWGVLEGGYDSGDIDAQAQAAFYHPGIAITASTGDMGAGQVQFPASSPYVTAVGGTTLVPSAGTARGWSESVWNASGSGCSSMFDRPAWQSGGACSGRTVPEVSVIADYNPGVAVYSSDHKGWIVLGGTSAGAPFVAGLYAAANDYGTASVGAAKLYAERATLNPVTGFADATLGSPNGLAAF